MRLLDYIGGIGAHAQRSLVLRVGGILTPLDRLPVEIVPVDKGPAGQKIIFYIGKWALHTSLSITVIDFMSLKAHCEDKSKPFHLGRHHGIGSGAVRHDDARVVDDAPGAGPIHETERPRRGSDGPRSG